MQVHRYATPPQVAVAFVAATTALVVASVFLDWPGRILALSSALLLGVEAVHDVLVRPTLYADADGLVVRSFRGERRFAWQSIDSIRAHEARRIIVLQSLEIEIGDELVADPGLRLGADPAVVADRLSALKSSADESA